MIAPDKNNYLKQIVDHFLLSINAGNELAKLPTEELKLGKIQNALNSIRQCIEGIVKHIILEKVVAPSNPIPIIKKKLYQQIEYLYNNSHFDSDLGKNQIKLLEFTKLRYGGNGGSHTSDNINSNPDINDYLDCKIALKQIIKWFYNSNSLSISSNIQDALDSDTVNKNDLPVFDDWFYFASQYDNFKARNTQYILITSNTINNNYSMPQLREFIKSDIDWHLIIDFDENSQIFDSGLCKLFNNEYGIENIRVYTPTTDGTKIDFTVSPIKPITFFYLAQESVSISNVKQWNRVNGKKLETLITKSRAKSTHSNMVVLCFYDDLDFLDSVFDIFNRAYESETNKITIAIISNSKNVIDNLKHSLSDFNGIFNSLDYYLIDSTELISGFSKNKKNIETNKNEFVIPAYTPEQEDTQILISSEDYEEYISSKFMEIVHKEIGRSNSNEDDFDNISVFYKGNEITWQGIAYRRGKGIDIIRTQMDIIEKDIRSLLEKAKRFNRFDLYHEPSSGGTTVAKRIAYQIGIEDYPTIILHQYHRIETLKGIEILYRITGDKPILAIIEEAHVGFQEMEEFERQFQGKRIRIIAVYVKRVIKPARDVKEKNRSINSVLDDDERTEFEEVFCRIKPERSFHIKAIKTEYKTNKEFITPFIYGLTAYESQFLRLEPYVAEVLNNLSNDRIRQTVGFISLIGKYTNIPIREIFFFNVLGFNNSLENDEAVYKILRRSNLISDTWEIRHVLIANEVCKQLLCGGDLSKKDTWRGALKNWLFDLIELFEKINPDGLKKDSPDKELLEAIFINKAVSTGMEARGKFSKLISEINDTENEGLSLSRQILKKLCDTFPDNAYFYQHLSRLYLFTARFEDTSFYDLAIKTAQKAIYYEPNTNTVYHTKGDAIVRKLHYFNKEFINIIGIKNKFEFKQEVISLYEDAEYCLNKCIDIDIDSPYGYSSFIFLITNTIDLGRKLSEHSNLSEFLEDSQYVWFTEKIQLAFDLIERLLEIYRNFTSDKKYEIEITYRNYFFLTNYLKKKNSYYERKEIQCNTDRLKLFYRNAYIIRSLQNIDFSNPQKAWNHLKKDELLNIIEKLKLNLRFRPAIHDLRKYLHALRTKKTKFSLIDSINFLEEIFDKETYQNEIKDKFLVSELAYYLYVLCSIQDINNGDTIDTIYFDKAHNYLEVCNKNNKIIKNNTFEFEWLGNSRLGGIEQMVNRHELKEFKTNEFTNDVSKLQEIEGKIISVGDLLKNRGSERKKGEIEFNVKSSGQKFIAYFIPIKGGLIEGEYYPCRFDDRKYENNQIVKFYLGFSYSGFRAWQPIPNDNIRANLKELSPKREKKSILFTNNASYEFRVQTVNNKTKTIEGKIRGFPDIVNIPFEENKDYQYYKHLRRSIVNVKYVNNSFTIESQI